MITVPVLLRERTFRRFWAGQSVSLVGDQVALFAVPIIAVLLLHAGAAQMGMLTAAGLLPSLLFSLPAGVLVDRLGRRRRTMLGADLCRAGLLLSVPASWAAGVLGLPQLYAVAFLVGTADVAFSVADAALFPLLVRPADYVAGQSLVNGSRAMSAVLGQGLAGVLIAALTAPGALLVDAASFLGSAISLAAIDPDESAPADTATETGLAAGVRFIRGNAIVRAALAATTTVNFFTFAIQAILVLFATTVLHVRPLILGAVLGTGAVGGILGSLVVGRVTRRVGIGPTFAIGCVAFPAPVALVPAAGGPHALVLGFLLMAEFGAGFGVMLLDVSIGAIFAGVIPHGLRARAAGAYRMVNYGVRPVGALTGGWLGASLGLRPTLWIGVAGATASVLWLLPSPVLRLREVGAPDELVDGGAERPAARTAT